MIKWDRPCYKCLSHFCDLSCKEPKHLQASQSKEPEQEPVAWGVDWGKAGDIPCVSIIKRLPKGGIEVMAVEYAPYSYTTPPQRTWVGLTADEIWDEWLEQSKPERNTHNFVVAFTRAIEAKLKQKNGYAEGNKHDTRN